MAESNEPSSRLSAINTATMGQSMPEVTLPDGQKVQIGTVGAMLINIRKYDELVARGGSDSEKEQYELEEKLLAAVPLLKAVGLFELFGPEEWIHGGSSEGRKFVGQAALRS